MVISSEDIKKAQEALKAKGMDPGPATGRMDAKTQEALSEFQKANNLPATGVLDERTAEKLGVALNHHKGAKPQHRSQESSRPTVQ
jgi:peptidoglycan hydrolase-like protein with peptidoglycan-binding domain